MQKLENLEITKVAFVPEGDNKKANVLLFKSKPQEDNSAVGLTNDEESILKRVLLAFGKALGFEKGESAKDPDAEGKPQDNPDDTGKDTGDQNTNTQKGVEDMKIDKSKLTPEELAQLEAIEKKAGIQETGPAGAGEGGNGGEDSAAGDVNKNKEPDNNSGDTNEGGDGDIYKGLHPAVAAELKALRKRADEAEDREMLEVAKKYELLGKKPEELAKTLKTLKAAGGSAYDDMIGILNESLSTVEKSGAFGEIGKKGNGKQEDAWSQIEKKATEIQKNAPTLTWNQAVDKACEQNPDLVAEYENNR